MHERVEACLDLLDPALTPQRLQAVLERFYGFWRGAEPAIDQWAGADAAFARQLGWPRRRRIAHLHRDLSVLGSSPDALPIAPPVFDPASAADVLGWLYVAEGSTLGGALIARRLRPLTAALGISLTSFTPYPEGPGPMWLSYLARLEEWVDRKPARAAAVAASASAAFSALEIWIAPLRVEAVA